MGNNLYETILSKEKMMFFNVHFSKDSFKGYLLNIKISKLFYILLNFFEVLLRNRIAKFLKTDFPDWYLLSSDFCKSILDEEQKKQIMQATRRIIKAGKNVSENNIISELSLGFWTCLFLKKYEHTIWNVGGYKQVFPSLKNQKSYSKIYKDLKSIRTIRNRVFHYEQVITYKPKETFELIELYIDAIIPQRYNSVIEHISKISESEELPKLWSELSELQDQEHIKENGFKVKWHRYWSKMKFGS